MTTMTTMTGWRVNWLGPDAVMYPPFQDVDRAIPRRAVARCVKVPTHRPPEPDCFCGYYISDSLASLHPLCVGLRRMNGQAAAAGLTAVVTAVELADPVQEEHLARTAFGALAWGMLTIQGITADAVIEGPGTWRGSALTVTGPIHVPANPGTTESNLRATERRYAAGTVRHDGDIVDLVERLAT
jgi:hypothetical protein